MHKTVTLTAILVVAAALLAPPAGAQFGPPAIQIVSPRSGATVSGSLMVIEVRVQNFILNPAAIGKAAKLGQGHWAVYVDGKPAGLSADDVVSIPNDTYPALDPGKHTIKVALQNNDRTPVTGAQSSEITVTIGTKSAMKYAPASGQPGIKILVPHNRATVSPYVIVWVKIRGLKANPMAVGTPAKAGEGHWHLYVDGKMAGVSTSSVADVQMTLGKHTLSASLHNNDYTPLQGAASDQVTVTVK